MKALVLVTDAFGGRGGIAKFNRDMLRALAAYPGCHEIVAFPRILRDEVGDVPAKVSFRVESARGKTAYTSLVIRELIRNDFDVIICGHINIMPLAVLARIWLRRPLLLVIHGIEAWHPHRNGVVRHLVARSIDAIISVSQFTKDRFLSWASARGRPTYVIPNCISCEEFYPGPKDPNLVRRYGLAGRTVLMTLARLPSRESYKGVDAILECLPSLVSEDPSIVYLVVGEGSDLLRLEAKAHALGCAEHVIFAGYVAEAEKRLHYQLADVFVMPGRGEGFGIVYLEAMACGIPVIASSADASQEAVRDGLLGQVVDPGDHEALRDAVRSALKDRKRRVPDGLEYFSTERFSDRWTDVLDNVAHAR